MTKGKRKTPFLKAALPGEDQKFKANTYFLGLCRFGAIFTACIHVFVYVSVYSLWAKGNRLFMLESITQLSVAAYLFLMSYFTDLGTIAALWKFRLVIYAIGALGCLPFLFFSFFAFVANR